MAQDYNQPLLSGLFGSNGPGNPNMVVPYSASSKVNPDDYFSAYDYSHADNSLGGKINNWFTGNADARREAYNYSQQLAQMRYEQDLYNSAVTRRVQDIKNAGLNPWLALQSGIGAAASSSGSPGGSAHSLAKPSPTGIGDALGSALKILGFLTIKFAFASASKPNVSLELDSIDKRNVLNSLMSSSGSPGGSAKSWEEMIDILAPGGSSSKGWDL